MRVGRAPVAGQAPGIKNCRRVWMGRIFSCWGIRIIRMSGISFRVKLTTLKGQVLRQRIVELTRWMVLQQLLGSLARMGVRRRKTRMRTSRLLKTLKAKSGKEIRQRATSRVTRRRSSRVIPMERSRFRLWMDWTASTVLCRSTRLRDSCRGMTHSMKEIASVEVRIRIKWILRMERKVCKIKLIWNTITLKMISWNQTSKSRLSG